MVRIVGPLQSANRQTTLGTWLAGGAASHSRAWVDDADYLPVIHLMQPARDRRRPVMMFRDDLAHRMAPCPWLRRGLFLERSLLYCAIWRVEETVQILLEPWHRESMKRANVGAAGRLDSIGLPP